MKTGQAGWQAGVKERFQECVITTSFHLMAVKCMYNARIHPGVTNRARLSGWPASDRAGIKRDHRLSRLAFTVLFLLYAQHYSPSDLLVPPAVLGFYYCCCCFLQPFLLALFPDRSLWCAR